MKLFKTSAIILRTRPLGEADRLITLLTWEKGKINAVAKGARRTKSKLAAGVDLFVYGHYVLYQGKTLATVTQNEIIESFAYLKEDPVAFSYATYFAELTERIMVEEEKSDEICCLLLDVLRMLKEGSDYLLLARAFELKLLSIVGYQPSFDECVICNSKVTNFFSLNAGGLICRRCLSGDQQVVPLSPGSVSLANYFLKHALEKTGILRAEEAQKQELYNFSVGMLQYNLELNECKSLKYIMKHFEGDK